MFPSVPPPPPPPTPPAVERIMTDSELENLDPEDSACLTQSNLRHLAELAQREARTNAEEAKKVGSGNWSRSKTFKQLNKPKSGSA